MSEKFFLKKLPQSHKKRYNDLVNQVLLEAMCREFDLPSPKLEVRFHPKRRWRFDFLFDGWLAVEVQGGIFVQGRHTQGAALLKEYEKLNEAQLLGYTVLFLTPQQLKSGEGFLTIKRALAKEARSGDSLGSSR